MKYYKCWECNSILETYIHTDLECLNCMSKNVHEITDDAPRWVKWCNSCDKKTTCEKIV